MSYYSRLNKSFEGALRLPLTDRSKYVLISDCHRGTGTSYDNFLKNQNLYFAALQHYYQYGYTYIELGDGDELWENRSMEQIIQTHSNVFWLLSLFRQEGRLYMLYGNHDMIKKNNRYTQKNCSTYHCSCEEISFWEKQPLFPNMTFHSGIILENVPSPPMNNEAHLCPPGEDMCGPHDVYLTHGHQSDLFNSTLWRFTRFLVRYFWRPLERFGVLDPTSAAKNYTRKRRAEQRLQHWATKEKHILITGHTHRPSLTEEDKYYYNSGSCVHPRCITCLEIEYKRIRLVKWTLSTRPDMTLYVSRDVLAGPVYLDR
ncbi:UDP-2,3-diacylglucosamine pyrophosphatase LpxH [Kineothrix alysoides]|uniref:UDP-2,3-diacylglucosamine pyrophosphatase LpxH n=1 Tax=Kineothrix alysoides TaxID=1469948 RepID=A0A4R1QUM8_9FIRM|nr:metallophosphoesterase [Kineothrix alysoides]TCL57227.1 UDP-2,3-diacylglucosamine pyrophosphatase LpxH [Kineothrix alysoides]